MVDCLLWVVCVVCRQVPAVQRADGQLLNTLAHKGIRGLEYVIMSCHVKGDRGHRGSGYTRDWDT